MSFAAADLFLARQDPPTDTTPPKEGSALFALLRERQTASLGAGFNQVRTFIQWTRMPDRGAGSTAAATAAGLPSIVQRLDRGEPVVLGWVLTKLGDAQPLWTNHQVLAFAAVHRDDASSGRGAVDLRVYDPNFPKRDDLVVRLTPVREPEGAERQTAQMTARLVAVDQQGNATREMFKIRGVFAMNYAPPATPAKPAEAQRPTSATTTPGQADPPPNR